MQIHSLTNVHILMLKQKYETLNSYYIWINDDIFIKIKLYKNDLLYVCF